MAYIEMNGKMRILVADADGVNAQAIKQYLKRIGYTSVFHQTDGYAAIHAIRAKLVDFVLCRMGLPIMDGPTLFEEMKSDFSVERLPFAIFEDRMSPDDMALLTEYGVDGTLSLPFVQKDLAELLARTWTRYIDKTNPEYLFEQARRLTHAEKLPEATKIYQALLTNKHHPNRALVGLGMTALKAKDLDTALTHAKRVVSDYPDYVRGHHLLGEVHLARFEPVDAIASLTRAIELSPKNPYRYEVVCDLLGQLQLWRPAEALYRKAIALKLDFPRLTAGLAAALANQSKRDEAIKLYEELIQRHPKVAAYQNNIAACHKNNGNTAKAIEHYRAALALEPSNTKVMYNLALLMLSESNKDGARVMLKKALELDPKYDRARAKLDEIEGRKTSVPKAVTDEEKPAQPATVLKNEDAARLREVMSTMRNGVLSAHGKGIEMEETERKVILGATAEQVRGAFHGLAGRTRRALVELVDGYATLVATLSGEVVEILGEVTQRADAESGAEGFSESTALVMTALQFQDQLAQLLNGFRSGYRMLVEKGLAVAEADFKAVVKGLPVEAKRKRLMAIATTVIRAPRGDLRQKALAMVESLELFGLELLDDLAKSIQDSHESLAAAAKGYRAAKSSEEVVSALEGIAGHFVILATRLTSLRRIVEVAVGCWLHADSDESARQSMLLFGKDLRGLWPNLESVCGTPEEREILARARKQFAATSR